ncbi:MAG: flagellar export chaperone FliS [Clostridiales bacterium]|jgi:flagellar protein FliS|nr:flagellar export chaperone FliS [Clostridiales bacterium]
MVKKANPYEKYGEQSILTAPPERLTLMLYDGALKFVNQAILALDAKDYMRKNDLLQKTQDIIREFQLTLNRDYEISKNFDAMYDYIYQLLVEGNVNRDKDKLQEASDLIREFRDLWKEAMKLAGAESGKGENKPENAKAAATA